MKSFEYADGKISEKEIMIAVASMVIGVGVLSMPRDLAEKTVAVDGWVSLLVGGIVAAFIAWAVAKLAANFPGQSYLTYASTLTFKPIAITFTLIHSVIALNFVAIQIRVISDVAKNYLFSQTPEEVIGLSFFLVVIYAVAGARVGLFRLNMLFLPIILFIAGIVLVLSLGLFEKGNLLPLFKTNFSGFTKGIWTSVMSYSGFSILWFYLALVRSPKKAPKMAAFGMCIPIMLYIFTFVICIGVFGNAVTSNLLYPTVELAKAVKVPGEVFERFDWVFFVIWIMAIFNTTSLGLDMAVFAIHSVFKKAKKIWIIFILSPITFIISFLPQDIEGTSLFASIVSISAVSFTVVTAGLFLLLMKVRGVKK